MKNYLEFKPARCKDCYKCLRDCPVKAIEVINHQAQIIATRCILCGKCTSVCPQNAKSVHTESSEVMELLKNNSNVIASIAPSFVSSFNSQDFSKMRGALIKLGFADAEETAIGANAVTAEYKKLLERGGFKNFITSACPAVNRMIQLYYPNALEFLAPVDSPMIAHAKIIKKEYPSSKIVFIGPCIAKKREAKESGLIDGVLTFEDLDQLFKDNGINLKDIDVNEFEDSLNKARYYPISRGIIKSFDGYVDGYEYVAVDGTEKCKQVLENINSLSGMFLELNSCEYACVNGPCSLINEGTSVKANADIRQYTNKNVGTGKEIRKDYDINFSTLYPKIESEGHNPSEMEINAILAKTGKLKPEDELNCGACGYDTCREKAWAVANGFADIEMCVPYMRERAESMSYEIIQNSPNGIVLVGDDLKIIEINNKALSILGINDKFVKNRDLFEFFDPCDFLKAKENKKAINRKKVFIDRTQKYVEISINLLAKQNLLFAVIKDITDQTNYDEKITQMKFETLSTTDEVIKKQMRVAQEIASLLGETTAETKVALLKLKKTLQEENKGE